MFYVFWSNLEQTYERRDKLVVVKQKLVERLWYWLQL